MEELGFLIEEFWKWTGLPREKWGQFDIAGLPVDVTTFPRLGEVCDACIRCINKSLSREEMELFLVGLAIDAEDEDILDACKDRAGVTFVSDMLCAGVSHPQSEARWQLTELLRKDIPQREHYLHILLADPDAYVRKRAGNVIYEQLLL